jgi:hypothetical protein
MCTYLHFRPVNAERPTGAGRGINVDDEGGFCCFPIVLS